MGYWSDCVQCKKRFETSKGKFTKPSGDFCCSGKCADELTASNTVPLGISMPRPPTVQASRRQEKDVAKMLGGKQVRGSGAISGVDGDVKTDVDLGECKGTGARQITLHLDDWIKTVVEAQRNMRIPSMWLRFNRPNTIVPMFDLVVLDKDEYLKLLAKAQGE